MNEQINVGILAVGAHLPDEIRKNDWWPKATVEKWEARLKKVVPQLESAKADAASEGVRLTLEAMVELGTDPFQGAKERRISPESSLSSELEAIAARDALTRAEVSPEMIDVVLSHTETPDYLGLNHAAVVHDLLGLRPDCMALSVEAVCVSFVKQLFLAQQMILTGEARYALITQCGTNARLTDWSQPYSPWGGDAATAVVVGPVGPGRGLHATSFVTRGDLHKAFVINSAEGAWYRNTPLTIRPVDRGISTKMMMAVSDTAKDVSSNALKKAGVKPPEIDFYGCHQPSAWIRRVTQQYTGLHNAKFVDTFPWAGSVLSATIPLQLATAQRDRLLSDGDHVLLAAFGSGMTAATAVLTWGR